VPFVVQVLVVQLAAKQAGYSDVVYLDAKTDQHLEEVSSCNIFTVKGNTIKTPPIKVLHPLLKLQCSLWFVSGSNQPF
jgi:branched-subunit amino acid aminotransferase/4-amino-4-deoxychorismate lyase